MEIINHIFSYSLPNYDQPNLDVELVADCVKQCLIANFPPSSDKKHSIEEELIHTKPKSSDRINCLLTLLQQQEQKATNKIINAVGGISAFCKLPVLPWQKELWPEDMTASLMRMTHPNEMFSLALKTEYIQDGVRHVDAVIINQLDDKKSWSVRSRKDHPFVAKSLDKQALDKANHTSKFTINDLHDLAHGEAISSSKNGESIKVQLYQKA